MKYEASSATTRVKEENKSSMLAGVDGKKQSQSKNSDNAKKITLGDILKAQNAVKDVGQAANLK